MNTWIKNHSLVAYYAFAYAISWLIALPLIALEQGWITAEVPQALHYIAGYGPMLAAFIVTWLTLGRGGMKELFGRMTKWRVGWGWIAAAIFGPFALLAVSAVIARLLGEPWPDIRLMGEVNYLPNLTVVGVWFLWLLTYGIGEETGWRGFALPHWQRRWNALVASLLLGVFWIIWHVPFFFYLDTYVDLGLAGFPGFALSILSGAIVFTWLYNSTRGSVLMAILFHASLNTTSATGAAQGTLAMIFSILFMVWAVALVIIYRPTHLARVSETPEEAPSGPPTPVMR